MRQQPAWNEPTDSQADYLDETFSLREMLAHFLDQWNSGRDGYWRVWGNTCEETQMELESLREEVRELRAMARERELHQLGL